MVVGSGMIAAHFQHYAQQDEILIFASGVSNSQLTIQQEYDREKALINRYLDEQKLFVYFSSISVLYPCLQNNKYVQYKLHIESYIQNNFQHSVIFRLPNLVGHTKNPHTLTNFLYHRIQSGQSFEVHALGTRYLLDVEHMSEVCSQILSSTHLESKYNIVLDNQASILSIVQSLETLTGKVGNYTIVQKGCSVDVDSLNPILLNAVNLSPQMTNNYNFDLLSKYYSNNSSHLR